ncbi:MAG: hypothetical protein U1G05_11750 [Kiritimatiellia bacterium]
MIRTAIDFDAMQNSSSPTTALGTSVETFCSLCHKNTVYLTASNPVTVGSHFRRHGAGEDNHIASNRAKLGCMSCHAGTRDLSGSSYANGAAPGMIHGGNFVWPAGAGGSYANAPSDAFLQGGYLRGWYRTSGGGGSCTAQCHGTETY